MRPQLPPMRSPGTARTASGKVLLALAAMVLAYAPVCVHAESPQSTVTVKVRIADLNPYTTEGGRRLYSRIEKAAVAACAASSSDLEAMMMARQSCVREAIGHAVHSVDIPSLSRAYIKRNGFESAEKFGITNDVLIARR